MSYSEVGYSPIVKDFEQDLAVLSGGIKSLPYLTEKIKHDGTHTKIRGFEPGLYLATPYNCMDDSQGLGFELKPPRRLTNEDSRNQVFFGDIKAGELELAVAVKAAPVHDLGELALTQLVIQEGVNTYEQFGYLVAEDGRGYYLTNYYQGTTPISAIDWREYTIEEQWSFISYAAECMKLLHIRMLFHGDLAFRNVVHDANGDVVVVDLEHAVSHREAAQKIIEDPSTEESNIARSKIVLAMSSEIGTVCRAVEESIFANAKPSVKCPMARFKQVRRNLLDHYETSIAEEKGIYAELLMSIYHEVLGRKKEEARRGIF